MKTKIWSCGLVAGVVIALLAAGPAQADLVGWWTFDDAFGLGDDSSTRLNTLTPQGGAVYDAGGYSGGAVSLDGVDDMLDSPGGFPTDVPTGAGAYAVSAWIKPDALPGTDHPRRGIVGWGDYGTGNEVNALRIVNPNGLNNYWWGADLNVANVATILPGKDRGRRPVASRRRHLRRCHQNAVLGRPVPGIQHAGPTRRGGK